MLAPPSNGVRIRVLDIPPEAGQADMDAVFENIGAADAKVDSDRHRSFHRTETIDFGIVLSGEIVLMMDEGETTVRHRRHRGPARDQPRLGQSDQPAVSHRVHPDRRPVRRRPRPESDRIDGHSSMS